MADTFKPDVTNELTGLWQEVHGIKDMLEALLLRDQKAAPASPDDEEQAAPKQPKKGGRRVAVYFDYDKDMNKIPSDDGEYGIVLTFDAQGGLVKSEHVRRADRAKKSVEDIEGWQEPAEDVLDAEDFKDDDADDSEGWDAAEDDTDGDDDDGDDGDEDEDVGDEEV